MPKLTRRELATAALGAAAVASAQTTPSQQATPEDDLVAARKQVESTAAALAKFDLPMSTEPAFQFKA